ncbi:hypothetical protein [Avibacterium sp. 21-599]|uniref:hypothetical protein n=1 Tax=Avibacterium sp. 21-599 TaxID=2911528 RepID=UPI00224714D5|nr:hypothetical protein [Avibacterium sp. 21-599]MCW9719130.1 hypothetical protein [Avibacterium sp. 21-599]
MSSAAHHNETSTRRKEVRYIFLPGEPVEKLARSCDYTILLGTVQEVVFNFQTKLFTDLTVEILPSEKDSNNFRLNAVYDKQTKKLIHGNFSISNQGIPYRVQVSRFFDGTFIVRSKDKELGRYKTTRIGIQTEEIEKPDLWLEPMYIGFSDVPDINQLYGIHKAHQQSAYKWVKTLDQFNHQEVFKPLYQPERVLQAFDELWKDNGYACIKNEPEEVGVFIFLEPKKIFKNKINVPLSIDPYGSIAHKYKIAQEISLNELDELKLILKQGEYDELENILQYYGLIYPTIDYLSSNKKLLSLSNRKIQIKWVKGYVCIAFKGSIPAPLPSGGLSSKSYSSLGGFHISKNMTRTKFAFQEVTNLSNTLKGTFSKLSTLAFFLDVWGDYEDIMNSQEGSKSIVELLGRVGINLISAILGYYSSSFIISTIMAGLATVTTTIPIFFVIMGGALIITAISIIYSKVSNQGKIILHKAFE